MATGVLLGAVVLLVWWQRQRAPTAPPAVAFPAPASDASQRIEQRLGDDHAFRNDVLFLLAATLRDRCQPAQAGCWRAWPIVHRCRCWRQSAR